MGLLMWHFIEVIITFFLEFKIKLTKLLLKVTIVRKIIIVGGINNINILPGSNNKLEYLNLMAQFNNYSCINNNAKENNTYSSTIDHVFIKNPDLKNIISIIYQSRPISNL